MLKKIYGWGFKASSQKLNMLLKGETSSYSRPFVVFTLNKWQQMHSFPSRSKNKGIHLGSEWKMNQSGAQGFSLALIHYVSKGWGSLSSSLEDTLL